MIPEDRIQQHGEHEGQVGQEQIEPSVVRRIEGRASETPEQIAARAAAMDREFAAAAAYDHVVVNETDRLDDAVRQVAAIIARQQRRRDGLGP